MDDDSARDDPRFAIGVMSGTSIDGLDAALVRIDGVGLEARASLLRFASERLGHLAPRLRNIAERRPVSAEEVATVAWRFGELHVTLIERLLSEAPDLFHAASRVHIAVHGQTVFHRPPVSWQLINDAPIRARWPNANVVSDLRQEDLALGGQGAPITPLADLILFRDRSRPIAIVNLGGFCNVTVLPGRDAATPRGTVDKESLRLIRGFDVCACNHILDAIARETMRAPFDEGGRCAMSGTPDERAAHELLEILVRQRSMNRSLGTGDEAMAWTRARVNQSLGGAGPLSEANIAASAVDAIARAVAAALRDHEVDEIVLAGGGAKNEALVRAIAAHSGRKTLRSDALGVPVCAREAMAMAILGMLRVDGVPITLPQVTGRRDIALDMARFRSTIPG